MAVLLGQKMVKDTVAYNDYAIGITLPLQIGNNAFNQSFKTIDQVKTNIKGRNCDSKSSVISAR